MSVRKIHYMSMEQAAAKFKVVIALGLALIICGGLADDSYAMSRKKKKHTVIQGRVMEQVSLFVQRPVSGASIKVYESASKKEVVSGISSADGSYKITTKLNGYYEIKAFAENYTDETKSNIRLKKDKTCNISFNLRLLKNHSPQIISSVLSSRSIYTTGSNMDLSIVASDKDIDPLMYRYSIDNKVVQDWAYSYKYSFKISDSDRGKHNIKIEVKDDRGGLSFVSVDALILRGFPNPPAN